MSAGTNNAALGLKRSSAAAGSSIASPPVSLRPPPPPPSRAAPWAPPSYTPRAPVQSRVGPTPVEKAYLAYKDLLTKGAYLSKTPHWLLASSTVAVPGHQPLWAYRSATSPQEEDALAERRSAIKQAERRVLELHDEAVRDMDEKLHHVLTALPASFAVPANSPGLRPTRLTMALALAREMAAVGLRPSTNTYRLLLQICLAEQDDRLAYMDACAIERAASRDRDLAATSDQFHRSEADRLRRLFEHASWMERRTDLLAQHIYSSNSQQVSKESAWYGSTEWEVAWGLFEDAKVRGVHLDRDALNALMKLAFISPELRSRTAALFGQAPDPTAGHTLADTNPQTVELVLAPHLRSRTSRYREPASFNSLIADLDRVLAIYSDFRVLGRLPTKEAVCQIAARLVRVGWSRAAVEMFLDYEKNEGPENEIDEEDWLTLLRGLCRVQHAIAMRNVWEHVVDSGRILPDVGLIQDCQNLAGAAGLPDLALQCLELYKAREVPPAEHHYAPIVEAWTQLNDLEAAFYTLLHMRTDGVAPLAETTRPILDLIVGKGDLSGNKEVREIVAGRVDEAWYALLDSKATRGEIDVAAANVIMQACVAISDFVRATETFNGYEKLDLTPDLETYHLLLDALLLRPLSSAELFSMLIRSLEDRHLAFTPATYERVIAFLCTQSAEVWSRDAFAYMDDLVTETKRQVRLARQAGPSKSDGKLQPSVFGPTYRTYEVMLQRCIHERDERALRLTEEMRSFGFTPERSLVRGLADARLLTGGRAWGQTAGSGEFGLSAARKEAATKITVDGSTAIHKPPRPSSIRPSDNASPEDGRIPPHTHDP